MTGFGEALRLERERRGISLEALSAETKVRRRHFLALEQDEFGELPGGIFRRGILRAYLHALELERSRNRCHALLEARQNIHSLGVFR